MNKQYIPLMTFVDQFRNGFKTQENSPTTSVRHELGKAYHNAEMIQYKGNKKQSHA